MDSQSLKSNPGFRPCTGRHREDFLNWNLLNMLPSYEMWGKEIKKRSKERLLPKIFIPKV